MEPHAGQPIAWAGAPLGRSPVVVIAVHGRNAGPLNILDLAARIGRSNITWAAPAAANGTWYPYTFLAPIDQNEPGISSGLAAIGALVASIVDHGIPKRRIALLGFSQGACLSAEYAVRHADRFGALFVLSGGLIGPPGTTWRYPGSFDGTPVLLGCSDADSHIPKGRVEESADVFNRMGADVTLRLYPGMGHSVNEDEVALVRTTLDSLLNEADLGDGGRT